MKKTKYIILAYLLIIICFFTWRLFNKPTVEKNDNDLKNTNANTSNKQIKNETVKPEQKGQPQGSAQETKLAKEMESSKPRISLLNVNDSRGRKGQKLDGVSAGLRAEYYLYILNKYADWTEKEVEQRWWELEKSSDRNTEENQILRSELDNLSIARYEAKRRATPPNERERAQDVPKLPIYTKDYNEMGRIWRADQITEEDVEIIDRIVERLNEAGKTNELLRNYWELTYGPFDIPPDDYEEP